MRRASHTENIFPDFHRYAARANFSAHPPLHSLLYKLNFYFFRPSKGLAEKIAVQSSASRKSTQVEDRFRSGFSKIYLPFVALGFGVILNVCWLAFLTWLITSEIISVAAARL